VPKIARLQQEIYVPCMAFFNYVNPWPETTHWPLRCSAPGDGMPPSCGRADFGPETSCGATSFVCASSSTGCRLAFAQAQAVAADPNSGPKTQF
jgi:hypothetical protein